MRVFHLNCFKRVVEILQWKFLSPGQSPFNPNSLSDDRRWDFQRRFTLKSLNKRVKAFAPAHRLHAGAEQMQHRNTFQLVYLITHK